MSGDIFLGSHCCWSIFWVGLLCKCQPRIDKLSNLWRGFTMFGGSTSVGPGWILMGGWDSFVCPQKPKTKWLRQLLPDMQIWPHILREARVVHFMQCVTICYLCSERMKHREIDTRNCLEPSHFDAWPFCYLLDGGWMERTSIATRKIH